MRFFERILLVIALGVGGNALAETFELDLLETDDLRLLYFDPVQTYLAPHVARSFHNSLEFQREIFDWKPYDKTIVILNDFADYGNAGAGASPRNGVTVFIAPGSHTFETLPGSERIYSLMNHELVHVANMDSWNRQDLRWRRFFAGKPRQTNEHPESIIYNYLTVPRLSVPRWYLEGAASFMETWMAGGLGRAQGGYDEMVFRAMVRDDAHFYSNLGIVAKGTAVDFQTGTNAYLYGTRFFSYLALEYSPQHVIDWLKRGEDSQRYYARQFEQVFGASVEAAWDDWIAWEQGFQTANLERVKQYPLTATRALTSKVLGSISKSYLDPGSNTLIGAFRYPGVVAHVGTLSLDDGSTRHLTDIKGPMKYRVTSTAWDPQTRTLFFAADNNAYRDLMAVNVDSGKTRMLIKDARIGDYGFNSADRSIWGLRHLNGYVSLVRIPYPYESWTMVHTWPYGNVAFELDVSPDGKLLSTSMSEIDGQQFVRVFRISDLLAKKIVPVAEFATGTVIPEGFVFSPDGRYLYGSSYYTGVSNIWRYEIANGEREIVSNAQTGFFRPIPLQDGSLIISEYTGQGFVPSIIDPVPLEDVGNVTFLGNEIVRKHPIVRDWVVGPPSDVDLDSLIIKQGKYRPGRELQLDSAYPVVEGYRDFGALGWHFRFADPAQLHHFNVTTSYTLDDDLDSDEKVHINAEYQSLYWHVRYWHNDANFYDLFGPTERSRKGDAFILKYDRALIYDLPRELSFSAGLAYFTGLDTLPGNQNVPTGFEDLLSVKLELNYTHTRKSLGAVDHEKGFRWTLAALGSDADGNNIPHLLGGFDFGFALPIGHSSIWLYNSAGFTNGDRDNSLANFYFGGYGNNYVDDEEVKRYREYDSFPGVEIDALSGQKFAKTVLEWNLPPLRFEEFGTPALFLSWARPALFASVLVTDPGSSGFERTFTNIGFQLDFHFTLTHRLPMTVSLGYAVGYEDGDKLDDEWLFSLKIL